MRTRPDATSFIVSVGQTPNKTSNFPGTMGKSHRLASCANLGELLRKRKGLRTGILGVYLQPAANNFAPIDSPVVHRDTVVKWQIHACQVMPATFNLEWHEYYNV